MKDIVSLVSLNRIFETLAAGNRQLEMVRMVIILLLITMIAYSSAELTWRLVGITSDSRKTLSVSSIQDGKNFIPPQQSRNQNGNQGATIASYHLFGEAGREAIEPVGGGRRGVPKTTLNLVLKGVIAVSPMARALAIINEKGSNNEDDLYGVGDKVPGGAELREIYADRVILLRSGKLETLMLEDAEEDGQSQPTTNNNTGAISSMGDDLNWQIDSRYWQRQINDIPTLAKQIGVDIYREGNVQKGFKLVSSKGNKLLSDMGLQAGDILYEVNGIQMSNAHNGLAAYQKIKDSSQITVKIGRDGRQITRIYNIK